MASPDDSEPVPRLPRSRGLALDKAAIFRIAMTLALLVMIIVTQRPCADAVSTFVTDFDETGSGAAARQMPRPGTVDLPPAEPGDYERITPDMTPEQVQQAIERAKARAAGSGAARSSSAGSASSSSTGSAGPSSTGSAGSGSATTP